MQNKQMLLGLILVFLWLTACTGLSAGSVPSTESSDADTAEIIIGLVADQPSIDDRSFNEYTIRGAQGVANENDIQFVIKLPESSNDYTTSIDELASEGADLIITVGFRMGTATARAAQIYPDIHFAIVDTAFSPGAGCPETVDDCYTEEGGLTNVTSLMFAEDEVGYLAGILAACMSESGMIASVGGIEIPPVQRFIDGFRNGAQSYNADIQIFNQYIPDFDDPSTGGIVAQDFINQGADVVFAAAGDTGNGALLAAHEAGVMAIGVDVDQYFTYPEVQSSLVTSASKNVDIAAASAVRDFLAGNLEPGMRIADVANNGVGLAPFHDWEDRVPEQCRMALSTAEAAIIADPTITGATKVGD